MAELTCFSDVQSYKAILNWSLSREFIDLQENPRNLKSETISNSDFGLPVESKYDGKWQLFLCIDVFNFQLFNLYYHTVDGLRDFHKKAKICFVDNNGNYSVVHDDQEPKPMTYEKSRDAAGEFCRTGILNVHKDVFKFVFDGRVNIKLEIDIFIPVNSTPKRNTLCQTDSSLKNRFTENLVASALKLYDSKVGVDFILVSSDGIELHAHRSYLIARSDVFKAMLTTDSKERRSGRCLADDLDGETLGSLLEFMYGRIPANLSEITEKLLYAADKYQVLDLIELCGNELIKELGSDNAARVLITAHKHSAERLKRAVIQLINRSRKSFLSGNGLKEIWNHSEELAMEVLRNDD